IPWKSYQEGIDLASQGGKNSAALTSAQNANNLTNTVLPQSQWVVPLTNFSGSSASYTNPYNGSHQFDYGAKHNPQVFFSDTNGGINKPPSKPEALHSAPLEQLQSDLSNNAVGRYNLITPDQFNDSHTALGGAFSYNGVTYAANNAADPNNATIQEK